MNFLNMGPGEMIFILALALLIFGPKRLPELARDLGKAVRSFQQASQQITGELTKEIDEAARTLDQAKESVSGALGEVSSTTTAELTQAAAAASGQLQQAARAINSELQQAAIATSAPLPPVEVGVQSGAAAGDAPLPVEATETEPVSPGAVVGEPESAAAPTEGKSTPPPSAEGSGYVI